MRILLIDPRETDVASTQAGLEPEGFKVTRVSRGEEGIDLVRHYKFDAILLELDLPDTYGTTVIQRMRTAKIATPILVVSQRKGNDDKVRALNQGADDYLVKPADRDELVARIRAVVRRSHGHADSIITAGRVSLNVTTRTVLVGEHRVKLSKKEYEVFELLMLRRGTTVTFQMLLDYLYGGRDEPEEATVKTFILKVRRKLDEFSDAGNPIETVFGVGYTIP